MHAKIPGLLAVVALLLAALPSCSRRNGESVVKIVPPPSGGKAYLVLPSGRELKLPVEFNHSQWRKLADEERIPVGDGSTCFPSFQKGGQQILAYGLDAASELRVRNNSGIGPALIDRKLFSSDSDVVTVQLR